MSEYMHCENVDVYLRNHEIYHSKEEILEGIRRNEAQIEDCKRILFGMCCATPCDIAPALCDSECMVDSICHRTNQLYEDLERMVEHNVRLRYIAENFDKCKVE